MLIRQGDQRNHGLDRRLACTLAAIAGGLNTAAFHAVGFFSANMTGNVSLLSNRLALGDLAAGAFLLTIVIAFMLGAALSTLLINAGRRRGVGGIYAYAVLAESVLLALLGCADLALSAVHRGPLLVVGLSLLMGLQNAVVTRISDARVRTTHVSGMATDIGIGVGLLLDMARRIEPADPSVLHRLQLHGATVASFLAGGVAGVLVYRAVGDGVLLVAAALLLAVALSGLMRLRWRDTMVSPRSSL